MARQYTTPQETIRVSGVDLTGANIYVTYSDRARAKSITITNVTVTKDGDSVTAEGPSGGTVILPTGETKEIGA